MTRTDCVSPSAFFRRLRNSAVRYRKALSAWCRYAALHSMMAIQVARMQRPLNEHALSNQDDTRLNRRTALAPRINSLALSGRSES